MSAGGTGLGLVVTKLVVERLGGSISISSIEGARGGPSSGVETWQPVGQRGASGGDLGARCLCTWCSQRLVNVRHC